MDGVLVAVATILFDFESASGVPTVLAGVVARNAVRTLVSVGAAFGAFQGDDNAYAFLACHIYALSFKVSDKDR